jgi:deazaflavin-dependent oxidoreductase (nitroreductase family)
MFGRGEEPQIMAAAHWIAQRMLASKAVVAVGKRVVPRTDVRLHRMTNGRLSLPAMGGVKMLLLVTTGRRSGKERVTPLLYVRDGDDFCVAGSNWGETTQPDWALNLLADPNAMVEVGGERIAVTARRLTGEDRATAWSRLLDAWPPYASYAVTAGDRELPVFLLQRAAAAG